MTSSLASAVEFADNPEPRVPCVLLVDTSGSMSGPKITQLCSGLTTFKHAIEADPLARKRVEISVVKFDSSVDVVQDFVTIDSFQPPALQANGFTAMGAGLFRALDIIKARKQVYKQNGVVYYRPWLFLMTDGAPTDDVTVAAQRVKDASKAKELAFFAIGVDGADMSALGNIAGENRPVMLNGLNFHSMFVWLSQSLSKVSQSTPGQMVTLPPTTGWTV